MDWPTLVVLATIWCSFGWCAWIYVILGVGNGVLKRRDLIMLPVTLALGPIALLAILFMLPFLGDKP